jgi:hypothetical protein
VDASSDESITRTFDKEYQMGFVPVDGPDSGFPFWLVNVGTGRRCDGKDPTKTLDIEWLIRVIVQGEKHGLDNALTHDDPDPFIEFFSRREDKGDVYFHARYDLSTILEHLEESDEGLWVEENYVVHRPSLERVVVWAKEAHEARNGQFYVPKEGV